MNDTRPSNLRARRLLAASLAVFLVTALAACGDDDDGNDDAGSDNGSEQQAPDADATLEVTGLSYSDVSAPAGGTLAIVNTSGAGHTFTSDDDEGLFDESYGADETITVDVPDEPGEYPYHCEIHGNMQATLTVE
jgi:plastocyanin